MAIKFSHLSKSANYINVNDELVYTTANGEQIFLPYQGLLTDKGNDYLEFESEINKGCKITFKIKGIKPSDQIKENTRYDQDKLIGESNGEKVILIIKKGGFKQKADTFVIGTADPCTSSSSKSGDSKEDPMSKKKKSREDLGLLDPYYIAAVTSPMGALSGAFGGLKGGLKALKNFNKKESYERSSDQKLVEEVDRIKQLIK